MSIMSKIMTIAAAVKRVAWDKIPEQIIQKYDAEMVMIKKQYRGSQFKLLSTQLYNECFGGYGYTKSA